MCRRIRFGLLWLGLLLSAILLAGPQSLLAQSEAKATLTRFFGDVTLLKNPQKEPSGDGQSALFGEQYFTVRKASVGDELLPGEVIQTGKVGRARLVYENGDQITVAANTSYQVKMEGESGVKKPLIDLLFGKIRSLIRSRDSNQAGVKVRTRSAVMGVRGTDFYVAAYGSATGTEVTVLRGKVAIHDRDHSAEATVLPSGYTWKARRKTANTQGDQDQVTRTSKQELGQIHKVSRVEPPAPQELAAHPAKNHIKSLEKKASQQVIADIKQYQPEIYTKLSNIPEKELADSDMVQAMTTRFAYDKAPEAKKSAKKSKADFDLDSYGEDVYEKYFDYDR